jgi:cysteine synthase A
MSRIHDNITQTIGNTPLVRLNRTAKKHGALADVVLKLEFFNPLSSVKDRIGLAMIDDALAFGKINEHTVSSSRRAATRASLWPSSRRRAG